MKIELTKAGYDSKVLDDEGNDLTKKLGVRAITVECEVNQPTRAIMEMIMIEHATVDTDIVEYHVGGYGRVKGLIMDDDSVQYLPGKNGVDWRGEIKLLLAAFDRWASKPDSEKDAAFKRAVNLFRVPGQSVNKILFCREPEHSHIDDVIRRPKTNTSEFPVG